MIKSNLIDAVLFTIWFYNNRERKENMLSRFTFRTEQTIMKKIMYIAKQERRTATKEIEYLLLKKIEQYEAEHGEITIEEDHKGD